MKKSDLDMKITIWYVIISIFIYFTIDIYEYKNIIEMINIFGIGIFGAAILIKLFQKFGNYLIETGKVKSVEKLPETKFTKYTFLFGSASLILGIFQMIILEIN